MLRSSSDGNPLRAAAIVVAAIGLVAGAVAVILTVVADRSSTASPEAAVARFFAAAADRDLIGITETLLPAEREALRGPVREIGAQLQQLGLLTGFDPRDLDGASVTVDALRYEVDAGIAAPEGTVVEVVAGRLTVAVDDTDPLLTERGWRLLDAFSITREANGYTRDFAQHPLRLVTQSDGGNWYVSLLGSLAIADADSAAPNQFPSDPSGATSPEDAVRRLLAAMAANDRAGAAEVLDPDGGAAALLGWSRAFPPAPPPGRPHIQRWGQIDRLDLTSHPGRDSTQIEVTALEATVGNEVVEGTLRYDGRCFSADYSFEPGAPRLARYESCGHEPVDITIGENTATPTPGKQAREREREQKRSVVGDPQRPEVDAFGQPFGPTIAEAEAPPSFRPLDNALSALAVFGTGSDLPRFTVVQRGSRWFVSPVRTLTASLAHTLELTDTADADDLIEHLAVILREADGEALVFEARDPDNVLFGPSAMVSNPLVAGCFVEVRAVAGGRLAAEVFPQCVQRLIAQGKVDPASVVPTLVYRECLREHAKVPAEVRDPLRRLYLADQLIRRCLESQVASGRAGPEVLERFAANYGQPCFGPFLALPPDAGEDALAAAGAEARACLDRHLAEPAPPRS